MLLLVAMMAAGAASPSAAVEITASNVELLGAGDLRFDADERQFAVTVPAGRRAASFVDRVWFDASGRPVGCDLPEGDTTPPDLIEAARTGCAQLMRSARFETMPGFDLPFRRGFVDVLFSFAAKPPGASGRAMVDLPVPAYGNVVLDYPAPATPAGRTIGPADGRLLLPLQADDYPPSAIRYGLESVATVLLGVDRSGAVRTCRPVGSGAMRSAYLDNHTCKAMLERASFAFAGDAPAYRGVKYLTKTLRWKLPL